MNGATLAHHSKLIDWCAQKQRQKDPGKATNGHLQKNKPQLTADKYDSIGKWCDEVNRLFIKPPEPEPPHLFRKCKYTEGMLPPSKSTSRTRSVNPPANLWTRPGKKNVEVKNLRLTGQVGPKPPPQLGPRPPLRPPAPERYVEDEKNVVLSSKMAESHDYYVQERKTVHLHIQPEFKRKLSTGWTINRPMLYPKVPPPAPPDNVLVDIPDYLVKNEENNMEVCQEGSSQRKASAAANVEKFDVPKIMDVTVKASHGADAGVHIVTGTAETTADDAHDSSMANTEYDSDGDVKSRGTQCVTPDSPETEPVKQEDEKETPTPDVQQYRLVISDRSTSNSILNVLSVDDCKMVMRYRPARVIDSQDTMILPPAKEDKEEEEEEEESDEFDPEDQANTTTIHTPIRLSQGSAGTTFSPSQMRSRVNAFRKMYDTYSRMTPETKVLRPSSAAVEKAFEVLLDKDFQACQSSRRPMSSPPKAPNSRPSSRNSTQSSTVSAPSVKFQKLNATLRKQMYDFLDCRWNNTKMKFQRTKNGYSKSAMKKSRTVTSSPKELWMSDEDLVE